MTITIGALLALSFLISVLGLFMFIWAQMNGLMRAGPDAAEVIFAKGEVGLVEDPSLSQRARAALQHVENESSGRADDDAARRAEVSADCLRGLTQKLGKDGNTDQIIFGVPIILGTGERVAQWLAMCESANRVKSKWMPSSK